jgi:hypothetical protein
VIIVTENVVKKRATGGKTAKKKAVRKMLRKKVAEKSPPKKTLKSDPYDQTKTTDYIQKRRESSRDIGEIPSPKNPERRAAAEADQLVFNKTYLPHVFTRPYNDYQLHMVYECDKRIENGGQKASAYPRRMAKTTNLRAGMLRALLRGIHPYMFYIGASDDATKRTAEFIWAQLSENELIAEDYPEICIPIWAMNNERRKTPLYHGKPIKLVWSDSSLVLPSIGDYPHSGCRIDYVSPRSSKVRGADHIINGKPYRPSIVFADDLQNDLSAQSEEQTKFIVKFFGSTIRSLAGYNDEGLIRKIAILIFGTCFSQNDFMVQMTSRDLQPTYAGDRFARVLSFPESLGPWKEYDSFFKATYRKHGDELETIPKKLADYYRKHKDVLTDGMKVIDETDCEEGQVDGFQYAISFWAENKAGFWTEQQNDPEAAAIELGSATLMPPMILKRKQETGRYVVPNGTALLIPAFDAGKHLMWPTVWAFGHNFSFMKLVDYFLYPEQRSIYIRKRKYERSLQDREMEAETPNIQHAIHQTANKILKQDYFSEDGNRIDINALTSFKHPRTGDALPFLPFVGVDCQDGDREAGNLGGIAASAYSETDRFGYSRLIPYYSEWTGRILMRHAKREAGEKKFGEYDVLWKPHGGVERIKPYRSRIKDWMSYDSNTIKSMLYEGLIEKPDNNGAITIFDAEDDELQMFAESMCSETFKEGRAGGHSIRKFSVRPKTPYDNDIWDSSAATIAIAIACGIQDSEAVAASNTNQKKRVSPNEKPSFIGGLTHSA